MAAIYARTGRTAVTPEDISFCMQLGFLGIWANRVRGDGLAWRVAEVVEGFSPAPFRSLARVCCRPPRLGSRASRLANLMRVSPGLRWLACRGGAVRLQQGCMWVRAHAELLRHQALTPRARTPLFANAIPVSSPGSKCSKLLFERYVDCPSVPRRRPPHCCSDVCPFASTGLLPTLDQLPCSCPAPLSLALDRLLPTSPHALSSFVLLRLPFLIRPERRGHLDSALLGRLCAVARDRHAAPVRIQVLLPVLACAASSRGRDGCLHLDAGRCAWSLTTTGAAGPTPRTSTTRASSATPSR